jgi:hypothetical protein
MEWVSTSLLSKFNIQEYVLHTLTTTMDLKVLGLFVIISSKGLFYSEKLCPSVFTGPLELHRAHFLSRS